MNSIQQSVTIPANRRLQLDLALPDGIPVGQAEMLIVFSPAMGATPVKSVRHLAGSLAGSAAFSGDPVAMQKALRDEWQTRS